jgi:hypothetical protein
MIVFGTKSKVVQGHHVEGVECAECGQSQFSSFGLLKYFHIFWIPFIPTSREAGMQCSHCKKTLVGKELPKPLRGDLKKTIFNGKNTAPMFAGLILFLALVVMIDLSSEQTVANSDKYVESPAVGDLYVVNFPKIFESTSSEYKYGVMRVRQTFEDGVEVDVSAYGYTRSSGADKAIRKGVVSEPDYFEGEPVYLTGDQLTSFRESRAILSVNRD